MRRVVVPSAAFLWGLQFAFLNPALALLLVTQFDATAGQVGWVLAVYNASGFLASLVIPAYADRRKDYLRPMLGCGVLTLALAGLLAATSRIPVAVVGLAVLGGPASVASSLLFAQLRYSGAGLSEIVKTRAWVSAAWIAGPPLATVIIGSFGSQAILVAIAVVALLGIVVTFAMLGQRSAVASAEVAAASVTAVSRSKRSVALIFLAFIVLQATNYAVVSVMALYVTQRLGLDVIWAGVTLGVAAALEIPALLLIGRLGRRFSSLRLLASGCVAGIAYYVAMTYISGPFPLIAVQLLNAWFFAAIAGVGLALFQEIIPRPGLASGLYTNTRRLGAIVAGPIIALGSRTSFGYSGTFALCAALTAFALALIGGAARFARRSAEQHTATLDI